MARLTDDAAAADLLALCPVIFLDGTGIESNAHRDRDRQVLKKCMRFAGSRGEPTIEPDHEKGPTSAVASRRRHELVDLGDVLRVERQRLLHEHGKR